MNLFPRFLHVEPGTAAGEEKVWLTALSSPPLSPPSLLEREEVKCTPSNKHTRMPMQNTLPSLLATAIFLKLMSSRAPEASLSLELLRGEVGWQPGRKIYLRYADQVCSPPPWIHLMPQPPNFSFLVRFEERKNIVPTFMCHRISWNPVIQKRALQILKDQPLSKHNSSFQTEIWSFFFVISKPTFCCMTPWSLFMWQRHQSFLNYIIIIIYFFVLEV